MSIITWPTQHSILSVDFSAEKHPTFILKAKKGIFTLKKLFKIKGIAYSYSWANYIPLHRLSNYLLYKILLWIILSNADSINVLYFRPEIE